MKAVLLSIRPKWVELIASGKKTIEIRKTAPHLKTPFKCYIYCTSNGRPLVYGDKPCADGWTEAYAQTYGYSREEADKIWGVMNGKVIGEFVCDRIESTNCFSGWVCPEKNNIIKRFLDGSCLSEREIVNYADGRAVCGWHISALKMYDEPKPLSELHSDCAKCGYVNARGGNCDFTIKRPPQSWCYVRCAP